MHTAVIEFVRSLCPDFRWLDPKLKREIRKVYELSLTDLLAEKQTLFQTCQRWQDRWVIELYEEYTAKIRKRLTYRIVALTRSSPKTNQITEVDIARAREAPIQEFYEGEFRRSASRLLGFCPFHQEHTPSFTIYPEQNSFWCFGCGAGGSVIDFVMKMRNCEFLEAVRFLIKK